MRGSVRASPTTATNGSWPATATPKNGNAPPGTYSNHRAALRAANREDAKVREGTWHDHSRGQVTFADYVATVWLPAKHVETSTLAAYRSYLDKHFLPVFGRRPMGKILPTEVQRWVTTATDPPTARSSRPRPWRSTTRCCTRSSNAPCATGSSPSTRVNTPSSPRW
jgi:hypothetical protein